MATTTAGRTAGADPAAALSASARFGKFRVDQPLHAWDEAADQFGHCWYPQQGRKSDICARCKGKFSSLNSDGFKCAACHKRIHTKCTGIDDASACRPSFERVGPPFFEPEVWAGGRPSLGVFLLCVAVRSG